MRVTERQRVFNHVNKAARIGKPATLTLAEWEKTLADFGGLCAYCQTSPYELLEHFIPVEIAGTHVGNCVPACTPCNQIKGNRTGEPLTLLMGNDTIARVRQYLEGRSASRIVDPDSVVVRKPRKFDANAGENMDDLLSASEVAEIWNERAQQMGYQRKYTRRSVNYHCTHPEKDPALIPALSMPRGNLFTRRQAWEFPISPEVGRKAPKSDDESLDNAA